MTKRDACCYITVSFSFSASTHRKNNVSEGDNPSGYIAEPTETGFYYVSSRYYDPEIGRFINADGYVSTGQDITGNNMFAYCGNNPVNRKDPTGQFWFTALAVTAVVAICTFTLSGCSSNNKKAPDPEPYSNQANCYAYAMKLENDPRTGRPFTRKSQPGEFSGNGLTARDLRGNSETVKKAINTKVSADAKVLNLNYTEVNSADHVPMAGNCNRGICDGFLGYYEVGPN